MDCTVEVAAKAFRRIVFNIFVWTEFTCPFAVWQLSRCVFPEATLGVESDFFKVWVKG